MRISDWSSDVCSSDLCMDAGGRAMQEQLPSRSVSSPTGCLGRNPECKPATDVWFNASGEPARRAAAPASTPPDRSEERRVGKECVSTCRSRWSPYNTKKKKDISHKRKNEIHRT